MKRQKLYMHQPTGNIMYATKSQAKKLGADWSVVQFVKNEKGQDVMRFTFTSPDGSKATVDVQQQPKKEVTKHGQPVAS